MKWIHATAAEFRAGHALPEHQRQAPVPITMPQPVTTWSVTVPPSANRIRSRTWHGHDGKSNEYVAWLRCAGTELLAQRARPVSGPVSITITAPWNGRRDLDNHAKPTLDLLVRQGLIDSDRYKIVRRIVMAWHEKAYMLIEVLPA